jgi:hypothetical protein
MAHFAKLNEDNIVLAVHVVNNNIINLEGSESEQAGIDFLSELHGHSNWKQTSYNARIRKNYAGIGYVYDEQIDAFIPPKPFPSWILDIDKCNWIPPIPRPDGNWYWDENDVAWREV